jgi:hypothetical protein
MVTTPVLGADLHEGDTVQTIDGPHLIDHFRPYPGRFVGDTARQAFDAGEHWRCTAADHELFHVEKG